MTRHIAKREVSEEELKKFIDAYPAKVRFDGLRYTELVPVHPQSKTLWRKVLAYVVITTTEPPKYYIVDDK
jgi:hypothetical protein